MGAGHGHGHHRGDVPDDGHRHRDPRLPWWRNNLIRLVVLTVLVPVWIATAVAAAVLWPHGTPPLSVPVQTGDNVGTVSAAVVSTRAEACPGTPEDRLPNGDIPPSVTCAFADVRLGDGVDAGQQVTISVPPPDFRGGISPGTEVTLAQYPPLEDESTAPEGETGTAASGNVYAWQDYSRGTPLTVLAVAFAVLVVVVARLRGIAALVGLGVAAIAIDRFMLPALRFGENPVAVALVTSVALMTVLLYLAHGISAKTTTALLGTIVGLVVSAAGASWATGAAHLTGLGSEENYTLSTLTSGTDLSGVVVCGIIVASLGILNDVTVTQASAVWEIRAHDAAPTWRGLFTSGMRVGRDHLASTVYTIVFAYAGAALPTLLLINIYQRPLGQILTSSDIAEELARTFVGSVGLIVAIPVTTAIAAALVLGSRPGTGRPEAQTRA